MTDMNSAIAPKSDQLNGDDLIGGSRTIKVTRVSIASGEQPVAVFFEGDNGKPYKPCKSMCRVMVNAWGADAKQYVGHSMTLYRDPSVKWGGMAIGGIRISHMSHIDNQVVMSLTESKGKWKPFAVKPLKIDAPTTVDGKSKSAADLDAKADASARMGTAAYHEFYKANYCAHSVELAPKHDARKAIAAAMTMLLSCTTDAELDAAWIAIPVEVCRELGAGVLDERRAMIAEVQS